MRVVTIEKQKRDELIKVAENGYPNEVCGLLIGNFNPKKILKIYAVKNMKNERRIDRYEINPEEYLRIEKIAEKDSLEIIGFFHSHPDHPPLPSATDREWASSEYSYIIISVSNGKFKEIKSWVLNGEKKEFDEEQINFI